VLQRLLVGKHPCRGCWFAGSIISEIINTGSKTAIFTNATLSTDTGSTKTSIYIEPAQRKFRWHPDS